MLFFFSSPQFPCTIKFSTENKNKKITTFEITFVLRLEGCAGNAYFSRFSKEGSLLNQYAEMKILSLSGLLCLFIDISIRFSLFPRSVWSLNKTMTFQNGTVWCLWWVPYGVSHFLTSYDAIWLESLSPASDPVSSFLNSYLSPLFTFFSFIIFIHVLIIMLFKSYRLK